MNKAFEVFVNKHHLFEKNDKLLLAVSGGIDSMVMFRIAVEAGFNFGVAHCNFGLRREDGNADEEFVRDNCKAHGIAFHTVLFDTKTFQKEHKMSVQQAARELRYQWFEDIMTNHNYQRLLTAHHQTDQVETILLNLIRGTGIKGLHGILPLKNNIARPMLFATRAMIESYAKENNVAYREDATNEKTIYKRNKIRKEILPILRELNPSIEQTFYDFSRHLFQDEMIISDYLTQQLEHLQIEKEGENLIVKLKEIIQHKYAKSLLYKVLKEFNFNYATAEEVFLSCIEKTGNLYFSSTHKLLINRGELLIQPKESDVESKEEVIAEKSKSFSWNNQLYKIDTFKDVQKLNLKDTSQLFFDTAQIQFPLTIRTFKKGDRFSPIGLKGSKLLSDWFVDKKINQFEKSKIGIIEDSTKKIIGILGYTISNQVKITSKTQSVLALKTEVFKLNN